MVDISELSSQLSQTLANWRRHSCLVQGALDGAYNSLKVDPNDKNLEQAHDIASRFTHNKGMAEISLDRAMAGKSIQKMQNDLTHTDRHMKDALALVDDAEALDAFFPETKWRDAVAESVQAMRVCKLEVMDAMRAIEKSQSPLQQP